jgi:hypothetical protein
MDFGSFCLPPLEGELLTSVADPDPHIFGSPGSGSPDPLVRGMDPDPDPSIIKQK